MNPLEQKLYRTKWFDYRRYNPEGCNLLFTQAWITAHTAFQEMYKLDVHFDKKGNEYIGELPWSSIYEEPFSSQLTRLRRVADKHGIPYKNFWTFAFNVLADTDHLSDEVGSISTSMLLRSSIVDLHEEDASQRIIQSEDMRFCHAQYKGALDQVEYYAYIACLVKERHPATWRGKLQLLWAQGRYSLPAD